MQLVKEWKAEQRGVAVYEIERRSWNLIETFYGGTGTLFISYNKATTSVGDRLD